VRTVSEEIARRLLVIRVVIDRVLIRTALVVNGIVEGRVMGRSARGGKGLLDLDKTIFNLILMFGIINVFFC